MILDILLFINYLLTFSLVMLLNIPTGLFILSRFKGNTTVPPPNQTHFISCIITSYGDPAMCRMLIDSLLKSEYDSFEVITIIDGTDQPFTFDHEDVRIIVPVDPIHSKLGSIKLAMQFIREESEGILILDPDNLAHPHLLREINASFLNPFKAIQARRKPKNQHSILAKGEIAGEVFYNFSDRKLPFQIGSSATIAGSGICIEKTELSAFLTLVPEGKTILGEDKMLQNYLVHKGLRIAYTPSAIVYDEKVTLPSQLRRQRARWLNAYFNNLGNALSIGFHGLLSHDWNRIIFGFVTSRPPVFINVFLIVIHIVANSFIDYTLVILGGSGLMAFSFFFLYVLIRQGARNYLWQLPKFVFNQFAALILAGRYRNEFGKTTASEFISIDEALENDTLP